MLEWNVIAGIPALVLGLMVMRAFAPYALKLTGTSTVHLGAALFWLSARGVGRSIWWDVFVGFGLGNSSNWIWNLMSIYATYHALKGFHLLLSPEERRHYSLLTVAFYPHRLWRRVHGEDEQ